MKKNNNFCPSFPGMLSLSCCMCLTCTMLVLISITGQIYDRFHSHNGHHNSAEIALGVPIWGGLRLSFWEIMHIDPFLPHVCHCHVWLWPHAEPCDALGNPREELRVVLWPNLKEEILHYYLFLWQMSQHGSVITSKRLGPPENFRVLMWTSCQSSNHDYKLGFPSHSIFLGSATKIIDNTKNLCHFSICGKKRPLTQLQHSWTRS